MNLATALALVKAYAATDQEPTLEDGEIQIILSQAKRVDSSGNVVGRWLGR